MTVWCQTYQISLFFLPLDQAGAKENSKSHSELTKPAAKQNNVIDKWCYNKYGCPFNNRV